MGTDILPCIEVKTQSGWKFIGSTDKKLVENDIIEIANSICTTRDRVLFHILTGYGTGAGLGLGAPQLMSPRGIPMDCSPEVKARYSHYIDNQYDAVNPSYVTLRELDDIAKKYEPFNLEGYINQSENEQKYIEASRHHYADQGVDNYTPWAVSKELYERNTHPDKNYKLVKFQSKCVSKFIDEIKFALSDIFYSDVFAGEGVTLSYDNVRVVFWYDQ